MKRFRAWKDAGLLIGVFSLTAQLMLPSSLHRFTVAHAGPLTALDYAICSASGTTPDEIAGLPGGTAPYKVSVDCQHCLACGGMAPAILPVAASVPAVAVSAQLILSAPALAPRGLHRPPYSSRGPPLQA